MLVASHDSGRAASAEFFTSAAYSNRSTRPATETPVA